MKAFVMADMRRLDKAAPICRANGYGLETQILVNPFLMEVDGWQATHREMMADLSPLGLHAPFEGVDIGHSDPEVEASTRQKLTWAVEVSEDFGVEHIVVHGDGAAGADDFAAWKAKALETLSWLLGESPDHIHIYLENTPMAMIDQMLAVYTEFDHPRMTLNLDIGHAFIEPQPRVIEWIEILGDRIGYSHLHNNNGKADRHQGVHDGEMACAEVLAALNEHAPEAIWSLEVDAGAFEDSLRFLAKHGFLPEPVGLDG